APTDTHRGGVDMGVRGFDSDDRGGGSEPTSPDRRERAGNNNKCQHRRTRVRTRGLVPTRSRVPPGPAARPVRGAISERLTARHGLGAWGGTTTRRGA